MTSSDGTPEPAPHDGEKRHARPSRRWPKVLGAGAAVLALLFAGSRLSLFPGLDGLFGEETHDRSGPAVLKSIQDMSAYEAASGNFQVVVDLEKDTRFVPDALRGTRTLFVGAGTVDASVNLGGITEDGVVVNEDRTEAEIRLPRAVLGKPALDPDRSYAVSKQRGLLDRLGDFFSDNPGSEQAVNKLAARHIAEAAKESGLTARAEKNTAEMLKGLLGSLGFDRVSVRYTDDRG
ncbi:DUF4230 domain-containing protein [Streptomyces sp. NPDC059698]|uniref:DUF4230 domain-containing protein n=1 Tax=unclassified Streptomyces TaxID=2593676 RepID=UPI00093A81C0|nr:DUF4230 domain-containing protein [Streptomyces sp. CB02366]OKJ33871.1 hypothetical protein AMK24_23580 [Streptomyces sp. CB02366]TVP38151.1 hypothetical protein A3L22_23210 [Streptomyces griseus subsp. griseus]